MPVNYEKRMTRAIIDLNLNKVKKYIDLVNIHKIIGNNTQLLKFLLDCDSNADNAECANIKMFEYFAKNHVNIDAQDKKGTTLLMHVLSEDNYSEFINLMVIRYSNNINLVDENGETALEIAANKCYNSDVLDPVTIALLEKGADPYIGGEENWISYLNNPDKTSTLLKYVKVIKIEILCRAVIIGNYDVVEMLLPYVRDIKEKCRTGKTALSYAKKTEPSNQHIIELLRASS